GGSPSTVQRMDGGCTGGRGGVGGDGPLPSEIVQGRVFGCIFDDLVGLKQRADVGIDQILFETDYPHSDGTFPHSRKVAHSMFAAVGMDAGECYKVLRGNAINAYGLHRFGIHE
ncbi:MAG: amidohydrolase family protein, partial [Acidimicrobiaceae bacterium]|nr:amidohydrolase family protein [Acidimicrobiaceae bacterium]